MKKTILYFTLLILTIPCLAQKETSQRIVLTPNGTDTLLKKVRFGSSVKFKIQNVNTFKITGYTVSKPVNIDFNLPTSIADIPNNGLTADNISALAENLPSSAIKNLAEEKITSKNVEKAIEKLNPRIFERNYSLFGKIDSTITEPTITGIEDISSVYNDLKNDYDDIYEKYRRGVLKNNNLVREVKRLQVQIGKLNTLTKNLQSIIDLHKNENRITFKNTYISFLKQYRLLGLMMSLENRLNRSISDSIFVLDVGTLKENATADFKTVYFSETSERVSEFDTIASAKRIVLKNIEAIHSSLNTLKMVYNQLPGRSLADSIVYQPGKLQSKDGSSLYIGNAVSKVDKPKEFENEFTFSKKISDILNSDSIQEKIVTKAFAGIDLYNKIKNESFILYTGQEIMNADEKTITPTLKYANGKTAYEFNPITIRTRGGIKVNFSTGYLLSFIGDDNYGTYTNDTGRVVGVKRAENNRISSALGVLAHAYLRTASNVSAGFSSGFSLNTDANLGFYLGLSGFFFEHNRLVITAGYSITQKQTLNKSNLQRQDSEGDNYKFINLNNSVPLYDKLYKGALFLGMTFNILKN